MTEQAGGSEQFTSQARGAYPLAITRKLAAPCVCVLHFAGTQVERLETQSTPSEITITTECGRGPKVRPLETNLWLAEIDLRMRALKLGGPSARLTFSGGARLQTHLVRLQSLNSCQRHNNTD